MAHHLPAHGPLSDPKGEFDYLCRGAVCRDPRPLLQVLTAQQCSGGLWLVSALVTRWYRPLCAQLVHRELQEQSDQAIARGEHPHPRGGGGALDGSEAKKKFVYLKLASNFRPF